MRCPAAARSSRRTSTPGCLHRSARTRSATAQSWSPRAARFICACRIGSIRMHRLPATGRHSATCGMATACSSKPRVRKSRCCTRRATITSGCCAPSCIGAAAAPAARRKTSPAVLNLLQLRDFVIVERADLEFGAGLTALTGETGAGKSIVVDALSMLAGGRAGADVVRSGAERAEATAAFVGLPPQAVAWLEAQSIDHDGEVILRRIVGQDGRSRAYINGQLVALQALRELADLLFEIHGQQEFQHLVKRDAQRDMLDRHAAVEDLAAAVAALFARYRDCRRELEALRAAAANRESRLDLLRYQLGELGA